MTRQRVRAIVLCLFIPAIVGSVVVQPAKTAVLQTESKPLSQAEAKTLKSSVPFTKSSITRGRTLFMQYCTGCHGNDGKAKIDVIADATDLTEPKLWKNGTSEGEIFRSIRDGAGLNMPPYKNQIRKEEDFWHLVNFICSLWNESLRPKMVEEKSAG